MPQLKGSCIVVARHSLADTLASRARGPRLAVYSRAPASPVTLAFPTRRPFTSAATDAADESCRLRAGVPWSGAQACGLVVGARLRPCGQLDGHASSAILPAGAVAPLFGMGSSERWIHGLIGDGREWRREWGREALRLQHTLGLGAGSARAAPQGSDATPEDLARYGFRASLGESLPPAAATTWTFAPAASWVR